MALPPDLSIPGADAYLQRARSLIERAIRRRWDEGLITKDADGVFTAFLGAEHIERLMGPQAAVGGVHDPRRIPDVTFDPQTPLGALCARLGLTPSQADLLAVLLACETDPACARLVT